jgi:hypothetical protein
VPYRVDISDESQRASAWSVVLSYTLIVIAGAGVVVVLVWGARALGSPAMTIMLVLSLLAAVAGAALGLWRA